MKNLLRLAMALLVAVAPVSGAGLIPQPINTRLSSAVQSPYDLCFYLEQQQWDQVDAVMKRVPSNYQFDTYKQNTPLMVAIDLYAKRIADKPKSFWQTTAGGAVKMAVGSVMVVLGMAGVGGGGDGYGDLLKGWIRKANENVNAANPAPAANPAHAVPPVAAAVPPVPPMAAAVPPVAPVPPVPPVAAAVPPVAAAVPPAAANANQAAGNASYGQRFAGYFVPAPMENMMRDASGALRRVEAAIPGVANDIHQVRQVAERLEQNAGVAAQQAAQRFDQVEQQVRPVVNNANAAINELRQNIVPQANEAIRQAGQAATSISNGMRSGGIWAARLIGFALLAAGVRFCWQGGQKLKSMLSFHSRSNELEHYKDVIMQLLHREDLNLTTQNSDGDTALSLVRKHMATSIRDREAYELFADIEQLILIRGA